jgi:hypothetical protein
MNPTAWTTNKIQKWDPPPILIKYQSEDMQRVIWDTTIYLQNKNITFGICDTTMTHLFFVELRNAA